MPEEETVTLEISSDLEMKEAQRRLHCDYRDEEVSE